jgi:hypothetical protein
MAAKTRVAAPPIFFRDRDMADFFRRLSSSSFAQQK